MKDAGGSSKHAFYTVFRFFDLDIIGPIIRTILRRIIVNHNAERQINK